jgi:hypothetical protein
MIRMTSLSALLAIVICGCAGEAKKNGSPQEASKSDVVLEVIGLIRNHCAAKGKGPQKIADLAPYETEYQRGYRAVKNGDVVVIWGCTVAGEGGGGSTSVVAHEKDVPTAGGEVGLENGTVKKMTADEFKGAPKSGKK